MDKYGEILSAWQNLDMQAELVKTWDKPRFLRHGRT